MLGPPLDATDYARRDAALTDEVEAATRSFSAAGYGEADVVTLAAAYVIGRHGLPLEHITTLEDLYLARRMDEAAERAREAVRRNHPSYLED